jgi:hypothetical protein
VKGDQSETLDYERQGTWLLASATWNVLPSQAKTKADIQQQLVVDSALNALSYDRNYQNPELSWEYFDGRGWQVIATVDDRTANFAKTGEITFTVPNDLEQTEIGGQKDYWIRARLVGGDYGRARYIVTSTTPKPAALTATDTTSETTTQSIKIDTSDLHPPEIQSIKATFALAKSVAPDFILVENNVSVLNQTQASAEANARFELFEGLRALDRPRETSGSAAGRLLFLGFSKEPKVGVVTLYVDAVDQSGPGALYAEVLTQSGWKPIPASDETNALRRRGIIRLFLNAKPVRASLLGAELCWLRLGARQVDGTPLASWRPTIAGLYANAVMVEQSETIEQELVGSSLGEPNVTFTLARTPVLLNDVEIRVRERLSDDEKEALRAEGSDPPRVVTREDLDGDWVLWDRAESFIGAEADDRVYRLDALGNLQFGGEGEGKTLPAGRDIVRAFRYKNGGGARGNVKPFEIKNLKTALELVDSVVNPVESAGGIDQPGVDALIATAPARIRYAQQALTGADFEALAVASSADIVRARYVMPRAAGTPIRLAVAVRTGERCPQPSSARREALSATIRERAAGFLDRGDIEVVPPDYVQVTVGVEVRTAHAAGAAEVERSVREALLKLMHPIDGGPEGTGWPFARPVWASDIYRALRDVQGLDRIVAVTIRGKDGRSFDRLTPIALVWSDDDDITVTVEPGTAV